MKFKLLIEMEKELYNKYLKKSVESLLNNGTNGFMEILIHCEGADPRVINQIIKELGKSTKNPQKNSFSNVYSNVDLPAADPSLSQWWFAPEGVRTVMNEVIKRSAKYDNPQILCIGCPTLVNILSDVGEVTLLDFDKDIVHTLNCKSNNKYKCYQYDVYKELPAEFKSQYDICIIDPPWYDGDIKAMFNRAIDSVKNGGDIFCTFPGRLTRPKIESFRTNFIKEIVERGHNIISILHNSILYQVPEFELNALSDIKDFSAIPWRKSDLFHVQKGSEDFLNNRNNKDINIKTFSRKTEEFRVFVNGKNSLSEGLSPKLLDSYNNNISTRGYEGEPDLWTSTKIGLKISNYEHIEAILDCWASGIDIEETISFLQIKKGVEKDRSETLVQEIENHCNLWSKYVAPKIFRSSEEIIQQHTQSLSKIAVSNSSRIHIETPDGFRPEFNRDRDRLIWSSALKRLADKTRECKMNCVIKRIVLNY